MRNAGFSVELLETRHVRNSFKIMPQDGLRHSRGDRRTPLPFDLPSVRRKKLTADIEGGNQSSDAGGLRQDAGSPRSGPRLFGMVMARVYAIARGCHRPQPAAA
jgi:hypothetical protein